MYFLEGIQEGNHAFQQEWILSDPSKMSGSGCTMLGTMPLLPLLLNAVLGFKLCPSPCLCYESSDLVDCRSRGLTRVPSSISHGTWLLDLSGNKVTEVHTRSFIGLWSLKVLLLSNNSVHILHPQVPKSELVIVHILFDILVQLVFRFLRNLELLLSCRHHTLSCVHRTSKSDQTDWTIFASAQYYIITTEIWFGMAFLVQVVACGCHGMTDRVHPGEDSSLSQGHRKCHNCSRTCMQKKQQVTELACLWTVWGSLRIWRKATQAQGKHVNTVFFLNCFSYLKFLNYRLLYAALRKIQASLHFYIYLT